jgi:deoxyhypusine synthase
VKTKKYKGILYKPSTDFKGEKVSGFTPDSDLLTKLKSTGFQATNLAKSVEIFNKSKIPFILGFTSNAITSGLRETISYFCKTYKPLGIVTTAGSIEQDYIKSNHPFKIVNTFKDINLRNKGQNRSGNIIAENIGYIWLESKLKDLLKNRVLSSTEIIESLSLDIKDNNSWIYQAKLNNIPIFCPAILDGAIGDYLYFHKNRYTSLDVLSEHIKFNNLVLKQEKLGAIILGGSIPKHYIYNANICRQGLDYVLHFTTSLDYDGSNAGANPSEAISWGKIKDLENSCKVIGDFTITFTLFIYLLSKVI